MLTVSTQGVNALADSYDALSLKVASYIKNQLKVKPDSCLGLPTGATPVGFYQYLAKWSKNGEIDWSRAKCFALDEYLDVDLEESFEYYLEHNLYQYTNLPDEHKFNPKDSSDYDQIIASFGGLDVTIVGIGRNGHIAFNEPGTDKETRTHFVPLTESTRSANAKFFHDGEPVPKQAVTMGIRTILDSRVIVLIANGESKQEIIKEALSGPIGSHLPASYLQEHPHLFVATDFQFSGAQKFELPT